MKINFKKHEKLITHILLLIPFIGFIYIILFTLYSSILNIVKGKHIDIKISMWSFFLYSVWQGVWLPQMILYCSIGKWFWEL